MSERPTVLPLCDDDSIEMGRTGMKASPMPKIVSERQKDVQKIGAAILKVHNGSQDLEGTNPCA